jgi:hypothetical protein
MVAVYGFMFDQLGVAYRAPADGSQTSYLPLLPEGHADPSIFTGQEEALDRLAAVMKARVLDRPGKAVAQVGVEAAFGGASRGSTLNPKGISGR